MAQKEPKAYIFVLYALLMFTLLGLEFAVLPISSLIDGRPADQTFSWAINWYGAVAHWVITMLLWSAGIFLFSRWAKRKNMLDHLLRLRFTSKDGTVLAFGVVFVIIYTVVHAAITNTQIHQIYREFLGFQRMYGNQAWITSIFQNLYYVVEFTIVIIMAALF